MRATSVAGLLALCAGACGRISFDARLDADSDPDAAACALTTATTALVPRTDLPIGANPFWVSVADLEPDGDLDLVATSNTTASISIVRGHGDGTFDPFETLATGMNPFFVGVTRLGSVDALPDIVTTDPGSTQLTVWSGGGQASTYPTASGSRTIAFGDFDRDGMNDLVITRGSAATFSVFYSNADGTLRMGQDFGATAQPFAIVGGDMNGDGWQDIVIADVMAGVLDVHLNIATAGPFDGIPLVRTTTAAPNALVAGDFDRNGTMDIAVTDTAVSVHLGNGDGTLQAAMTFAVASTPISIAAADVTGDGILDLAAANDATAGVSLLVGNGDGTFQPFVLYGTGARPYSVAAGDLDADGRSDLVVANETAGTLGVLLASCPR